MDISAINVSEAWVLYSNIFYSITGSLNDSAPFVAADTGRQNFEERYNHHGTSSIFNIIRFEKR